MCMVSLINFDFGRLKEEKYSLGDFYSTSPEKVTTFFSESLKVFSSFFTFIMLLFFLPQIEPQMKWKKISIEIQVKMKSNHSFIFTVNNQKASSLFPKLAKSRKRVLTH